MNRGRRGSILALACLLTVAVMLATRLCSDLMRLAIAAQKAQTAADFGLLSALRVRGQSLETIAERWNLFGAAIAVTGGQPEAPAGLSPAIAAAAQTLRRSLSGFQGRVSSALTVAAEANGADRDLVVQIDPSGLRLGVEGRRAALLSPGMPAIDVDDLWYRRTWGSRDSAGGSVVSVGWRTPRWGGVWTFSRSSAAHLAWDADAADPAIGAAGQGGFAPDWASAIAGPLFRPHRFAVFRAEAGRSGAP